MCLVLNGVISMSGEIVVFVLLAAIANILGGFIILIKKSWSRRSLNSLMALSAGLLFSIAVVDLIPEALELQESSPIFVIIGVVVIFFFQQFIASHFHFGEETHKHAQKNSTVIGALSGMLIHTFFDGLSIVASFEVDFRLGITVLFAVLLHKIPDGLTISSIVLASLENKKKAVGAAILLGVSTILGAITAVFLTGGFLLNESMIAIAISFTAGIFLYVAGTDLLPVVNAAEDRLVASFFFNRNITVFCNTVVIYRVGTYYALG